MIVYFSTVFRSAPIEQAGELVKLDWESKKILARAPITPKDHAVAHPNHRGGTRGGRGILLDQEAVYVAAYDLIHIFDQTLQSMRSLGHPLFADLHELAWDVGSIWATSTAVDGAIKVDRYGNTEETWWAREDPLVAACLSQSRAPADNSDDNSQLDLGKPFEPNRHAHLNAIAVLDGRPLVLMNWLGRVVRLQPTENFIEDRRLFGAHNLCLLPDQHIAISDTLNQSILIYNTEGRFQKAIDLRRLWAVRRIRWRFAFRSLRLWLGRRCPSFRLTQFLIRNIEASRPVFVRGLCLTPRNTLLVGISPASILELDWRTGTLVDFFAYSHIVHLAVHGLACDQEASTAREKPRTALAVQPASTR